MFLGAKLNCLRCLRVLFVCLITLLAGCLRAEEQTIVWPDRRDSGDVEVCADYFIYPVTKYPFSLVVWQWRKGTIQKAYEIPCDKEITSAAIFAPNMWVCDLYAPKHEGEFCVFDTILRKWGYRWKPPKDWHVALGRGSWSGNHVAVWSQPENYSFEPRNQIRFGLVAADGKSLNWAVTIKTDNAPDLAESWKITNDVVPSNDGRYIGVPGWKRGILMVDVTQKKPKWVASSEYKPGAEVSAEKSAVSWSRLPLDELDATDLVFSPDSRLVYVGSSTGLVYGMKTETGEVVNRWWATLSNENEPSHYITRVAVSPDGRFVAAGTVPNGLVFLFFTKDGHRYTFKHNRPIGIDLLSFSPDSKRLAAYAAGEINIWKLPELDNGKDKRNGKGDSHHN
ncbi:MAG: WD40 repeat domain-containing protein [Thermoguttaceae bacterium]